jgi:hypothetical protein
LFTWDKLVVACVPFVSDVLEVEAAWLEELLQAAKAKIKMRIVLHRKRFFVFIYSPINLFMS